jgi:hypothetical protein
MTREQVTRDRITVTRFHGTRVEDDWLNRIGRHTHVRWSVEYGTNRACYPGPLQDRQARGLVSASSRITANHLQNRISWTQLRAGTELFGVRLEPGLQAFSGGSFRLTGAGHGRLPGAGFQAAVPRPVSPKV